MDVVQGFGEVGQALHKVIGKNVEIQDPAKGYIYLGQVDTLNVCIPFNENFLENVRVYMHDTKPKLTIVHSTVPVGTCDELGDVAYSFVRGMHPNLTEMVKFTKHVAARKGTTLARASRYLYDLGFKLSITNDVKAVEFGKLFDTTYYGVCIAWTKEAKRMADEYNISWDVIEHVNRSYNKGYSDMGDDRFVRPNLFPIPGKIGGHCVVPNAEILRKDFKSKLLDSIIESE